jgi:hypothetical protein
MKNKIWVIVVGASLAVGTFAQQVSDTSFAPPIPNPMYKSAKGPVVLLDEAHFNFHILPMVATSHSHRFFDATVTTYGRRKLAFSKASLKDAKSTRDRKRVGRTEQGRVEIANSARIHRRRSEFGQRLGQSRRVVAADSRSHAFSGSAENLARAFGIHFSNGYAIDPNVQGPMLFKLENGSLNHTRSLTAELILKKLIRSQHSPAPHFKRMVICSHCSYSVRRSSPRLRRLPAR